MAFASPALTPSLRPLQRARRHVLWACLSRPDGHGLTSPRPSPNSEYTFKRPYGYWKSMKNVVHELTVHIETLDKSHRKIMPTQAQLLQAGRRDLAGAIGRHGWTVVAHEMDLPLSSIAQPRSLNLIYCTKLRLASGRMHRYMHWREFNNVDQALRMVMADMNSNSVMPTAQQLIGVGRSDLVRAIQIHGGWSAVADRLGVKTAAQVREARTQQWLNLDTVAKEVRRVAQQAELEEGRMPNMSQLKRYAKPGFMHVVQRRWGGTRQIAKLLDMDVGF